MSKCMIVHPLRSIERMSEKGFHFLLLCVLTSVHHVALGSPFFQTEGGQLPIREVIAVAHSKQGSELTSKVLSNSMILRSLPPLSYEQNNTEGTRVMQTCHSTL